MAYECMVQNLLPKPQGEKFLRLIQTTNKYHHPLQQISYYDDRQPRIIRYSSIVPDRRDSESANGNLC